MLVSRFGSVELKMHIQQIFKRHTRGKSKLDILPGPKARGFLEYKYARHLQS
jgi:hypothetical protein